MQAGAAVADLGTGDHGRAVVEAGGRGGAARALGDVLVHLAVLERPGAEALDRRDDHRGVQFLDAFPGEAHAIEHAGGEVFDHYVAGLDQRLQHLLALGRLGVEGDGPLVVVQHGEIQAVGVRQVAQLAAGDVTLARPFDLDDVGAEPGEQLGAGRPRLHMREVENPHALKCFAHACPPYYPRSTRALRSSRSADFFGESPSV